MTAKNGLPCKKCGAVQWRNDGSCLQCKSDRDRRWYVANREKCREKSRKWYAANRDMIKERMDTDTSRERRRENARKFREANREKRREDSRKWGEANRDKKRESERRRRDANPERHRERQREISRRWQSAYPEKRRAIVHRRRTRISGGGGSYTDAEFIALCKQYGNRCVNPRCPNQHLDEVKLTADHVVPVAIGGSSYISNIQPLCQTCNSRKGTRIIDYRNKPIARRWVQPSLFVAAARW